MCWVGRDTDRKVAEKDIIVYKYLYPTGEATTYQSPYIKYNWLIGNPASVVHLSPVYCGDLLIEKGYHSSRSREGIDWIKNSFPEVTLMLARIPKGTVYYENQDGDIVSETLVIMKEAANG